MSCQKGLFKIFARSKGKTHAVLPSTCEVTDRYEVWKKWELLEVKSPLTANLFVEMLNLYDDIKFAVAVHSPSNQIDFGLVALDDGGVVVKASYDPVQEGWLHAGKLLTDHQNHDALLQGVLDRNLAELHGKLCIGMTGPRVQLMSHPDAFRAQRQAREAEALAGNPLFAPLPPWLAGTPGGIVPWSDLERALKERNRLTPRNLWDAIVCAGAGVPRGSTFE